MDSFEDLVASKMVALVERGAPRDFRDIHALCTAELIAPAHCWQLWRQRQNLAGSDANPDRAKLAVETHLTRISLHRPRLRFYNVLEQAASRVAKAFENHLASDSMLNVPQFSQFDHASTKSISGCRCPPLPN